MNWFNPSMLYSIPDEIGSLAGCSLNSYVIQCLNKHYSQNNFKHIPDTLLTLITTYTDELFGCINQFETKYRKLIHESKSKIYHLLLLKVYTVFMMLMMKGTMIMYMHF